MPQIIIHRGTQTIGGSCIEIKSNQLRILFDIGAPLMEVGGGELKPPLALGNPSVENGILPPIKGLYKGDIPEIAAVFISHAHMDHCGLLNHIHPEIPVFVSKGTHSLLDIGRVFYPSHNKIYFKNFKQFEHWRPVTLGSCKITSYLMDHSGYDASAFLIEVDNKKIFYSGDFRGHGRKSKLFEKIIEKPMTDIDCLLMEGTTLGGEHQAGFESEESVEQELIDIFSKQTDMSMIMSAGSNVDRLVSLYRATKRTGRTLVVDLYTYYLLDQLKKITPNIPPYDEDHIRIYYIAGHAQNIADYLDRRILHKYRKRKIGIPEIVSRRNSMVLKLPLNALKQISNHSIAEKPFEDVKFIFSMWKGYLDKSMAHRTFCKEYNAKLVHVHVSGHAYLKDLQKLANALKPKKLIPIHTLARNDFSSLFENVVTHDDHVPFDV